MGRCKCPFIPSYCDAAARNPRQSCPGGIECPKCSADLCECPEEVPSFISKSVEQASVEGAAFCDPAATDPPQICPGDTACPQCGDFRCKCPFIPSYCDAAARNPRQTCPGGFTCPVDGVCLENGTPVPPAIWCDPINGQLCPGGIECPKCSADLCEC